MLVMILSDQALEIVRSSPEVIGAEVWRKLLLGKIRSDVAITAAATIW